MFSFPFRLFVATLVLAGCTYSGPPANPIERSLTWFSYIAGDDIRAACRPGAPDQYRFVYNAIYEVQIRAYDLRAVEGGGELTVRARGRSGELRRFSIDQPFGPWDLIANRATLDDATAARIVEAYAADVATAPPSAGQQLDSNEYYWIVAYCSGGNFALNVFRHPRVDTNALAFPPLLLAHDTSGVPFRKAEFVEGFTDNVFTIRVNDEGTDLWGRL